MDTKIVVSLSDKVRTILSLYGAAYKKSLQKMTNIRVHIEGSYLSNSTIINVGQSQSRGTKHKREIEGVEKTEILVQLKKTRK